MSNFEEIDKMVFHICSGEDTEYRADFKSFYEASPELNGENGLGKNFYAFYSSRLALLKCLEEMNLSLPINRLKSSNNLHLDNIPHLVISISHTEYLKGHFLSAATLAHTKSIQSIGIDIESNSRDISEKIQSRFQAENDDMTLSPIESWIRKEAAYKAISPLLSGKGLDHPRFKDISVMKKKFEYATDLHSEVFSGDFRSFEIEFDERKFLTTIASIPALESSLRPFPL